MSSPKGDTRLVHATSLYLGLRAGWEDGWTASVAIELASSLPVLCRKVERLGAVLCGCCSYIFPGNITPLLGGLFHANVP